MKTTLFIFILLSFSPFIISSDDNTVKLVNASSNDVLEKSRTVEVGGLYQHCKGNFYRVIAIARNSENPTLQHVVYQGLYSCDDFGDNPIWVRPYDMFIGTTTVNGNTVERFKKIDEA